MFVLYECVGEYVVGEYVDDCCDDVVEIELECYFFDGLVVFVNYEGWELGVNVVV